MAGQWDVAPHIEPREYEQEVRVALRSQCGTGTLLPREPRVCPSRIQRRCVLRREFKLLLVCFKFYTQEVSRFYHFKRYSV